MFESNGVHEGPRDQGVHVRVVQFNTQLIDARVLYWVRAFSRGHGAILPILGVSFQVYSPRRLALDNGRHVPHHHFLRHPHPDQRCEQKTNCNNY